MVGDGTSPWETASLTLVDIFVFLTSGVLVMLTSVFIAQMARVHLVLACKNLTTIEELYDNMRNPFDQGSVLANLSQVFGSFDVDWVLPITPKNPLCDGVTFRQ